MSETCPLIALGVNYQSVTFPDLHEIPPRCLQCARTALSAYNVETEKIVIEPGEDLCLDFFATKIEQTETFAFYPAGFGSYVAEVDHGTEFLDGEESLGWQLNFIIRTVFDCELVERPVQLTLW